MPNRIHEERKHDMGQLGDDYAEDLLYVSLQRHCNTIHFKTLPPDHIYGQPVNRGVTTDIPFR